MNSQGSDTDQDDVPLLNSENRDHSVVPPVLTKGFHPASEYAVLSLNTEDEGQDLFQEGETECQAARRLQRHVKSPYTLSAEYESLDYDTCENQLLLREEEVRGPRFEVRKDIARWFVFLMIGVLTGLTACAVDISIEMISEIKYTALAKSVDDNVADGRMHWPFLLWVATNVGPVLIGSLLVTYIEPVAAGSGIPQVKCYLNGVKVPRLVRVKTLLVKVVGVILSVVGGLAGGKEGPMIHSGAVIAAGVSQGKSSSLGRDMRIFKYFREDHEKRDFVSGGAAAGVAAAFGAPVGGVLFSLEEGASFWNQALTWRTFFASVMSTFTLNVVLSAYHGHPGELSYPGLLNLGQFEPFSYELYELPIFLVMGSIGGLLGAMWNYTNTKLTIFRKKYIIWRWMRVIEACIVAATTAAGGCLLMVLLNDCRPLGQDPTKFPVRLYCGDGEYNAVAALWFQTPEASVRSLFHDPPGAHSAAALALFVLLYLPLACWTFGLSVSIGLFIPALLTGAAWGRLSAILMRMVFANDTLLHPGKFAFVGAAAMLGGVVRMTLSLSVILIETTGNISFALPIILTLIAAKWTGDFFNEGIYDTHIQILGVPLLPWSPPPLSHDVYASAVMSAPVITLRSVENVGRVASVLQLTTHNGFPIVDPPKATNSGGDDLSYSRLRGLILRDQLIVLLRWRMFIELASNHDINNYIERATKHFRDEYPRYPTIDEVELTEQEKTYTLDLRPFMSPSPYTVQNTSSLPRMFRLFRALGLRHLPIVNETNEVIGIVTRKDLAKFRVWRHWGQLGFYKVSVADKPLLTSTSNGI